MDMQYRFKVAEELFWAIAVAVGLALAEIAFTFEPEKITDWRTWAIAVVGSLVRTIGGAILAFSRKPPSVEG